MLRPFVFLLAIAVPATAQSPQLPKAAPGAADPSRVVAGTYTVDAGHTQATFTLNHLGFSDYTGMFVEPTGTLTLDPANLAGARVEIAFPVAKVRTTVAGLDQHLQKSDFFDAAKFPEIRFVSTKVEPSGTRARISGNLTMRGVTRPVVLDAEFVGAGRAPMGPPLLNIGFRATTQLKRSDWGMTYAARLVGDDVTLQINAAFAKS